MRWSWTVTTPSVTAAPAALAGLLAEIACLHRPVVTRAAEEFYDGRITLAEGLGMRPAVAHCHLGLGKLSAHGQARAGARAPHHRHDDVPRDGHAVLAGAGGGGDSFIQADRVRRMARERPRGEERLEKANYRRGDSGRMIRPDVTEQWWVRSPQGTWVALRHQAGHAERRRQHHAAATGEVNCLTPPRRSGSEHQTTQGSKGDHPDSAGQEGEATSRLSSQD
jgi:hypothetical protein